ncbi:hypothetical protein ACEPAF_1543 [Sanghuangporus sanghuang]|uniref:SnoaL-like domain-containing protein n=1 Tax=Sanghuangporus baumii TaxID=108892 RepID=A0A9Q5HWS0_SANBA|nr:hypothetical protein A7U60_g5350 [Sanghuangporus baumii]
MTTKTETIKKYIAKMDAGDIDGCYAFVTDDFVYLYHSDPKPSKLGYSDSGLGKAQYKDLCAKIKERHHDFSTTISSITEEGDKVHVKGTTKYSYDVPEVANNPAHTVTAETVFTSEYSFSGDKICFVNATPQLDAQ